jgi:hypothetical protein
MKELIEATDMFQIVHSLLNKCASELKEYIRSIVDGSQPIAEIFLYYTGHGYQCDGEFYLCATDFNAKRPNDTGLSTAELHLLLRSADAKLVVMVFDACSSGTLLVKSDGSFFPVAKDGLNNLIRVASCLDSQSSLAGDPLSVFTEKFIEAALRKPNGVVYYSDITNALRDDFLSNNVQTPHFISQGTAREQFVDDAKRLDEYRKKFLTSLVTDHEDVPAQTAIQIIRAAEAIFGKQDTAQAFIDHLKDRLVSKINEAGFGELFDVNSYSHSDYFEPTAQEFIIRVLSGENRPDNFVTCKLKDEHRKVPAFFRLAVGNLYGGEPPSHYELRRNCDLTNVQFTISLTPRYVALKRFILVVSCIPSLELCYVMEILTQHSRTDWDAFDTEGKELVRRWYKLKWTSNCDSLVDTITERLKDAVRESVDQIAKSISADHTK